MKIAYLKNTQRLTNNPDCTITDYDLGENCALNGVLATIQGRYPNQGHAINQKSHELAYVIKGQGKVTIEGRDLDLQQGDLVLIDAGEKYYWQGQLELFLACSPAWSPDQHEYVD